MFCSNCGKEVKDGSKFCDNCGANLDTNKPNQNEMQNNSNNAQQKQKMHGCLKAFLIFTGIFIFLGVLGALVGEDSSKTSTSLLNNQQESKFEIINSAFCRTQYGSKAVCGTIKNNSDKNYSYVQVSVNLFDSNENLINSTLANINNLAPGMQWKFEAPILDNNVKSYKIEDVTGF